MTPSVSSLPPLPSSPQLLTTSGYTCSAEFRFQTERCLALVFLQDQYQKQAYAVSQWSCGQRRGAPNGLSRSHTLQTSPAPASSPLPGLPPPLALDSRNIQPYHHESRLKNEKFPPWQDIKFITSSCFFHAVTSPVSFFFFKTV